jgi:histone deacetylase 6
VVCLLLPPTTHHHHSLDKLSRWSCSSCTDHLLDQEAAQYDSVFLTADSYQAAQRAVNALCTLTDQVIARWTGTAAAQQQQQQQQQAADGTVAATAAASSSLSSSPPSSNSFGFAIIRPPGHHAEPHGMGGYCLLNNVATAARYVQSHHHPATRMLGQRILIVDWDVHHGNGTQKIFESDPTVLYFSVHRGGIYPYTSGRANEVGTGDGTGYTVNVMWQAKSMGDDEYLAAFQHILLPLIDQFAPTLVFISAGFDAAVGDLGECCVTPAGFAALTRLIRYQLLLLHQQQQQQKNHHHRSAPILCSLEGGYVRRTLAQCVVAVVEALLEPEEPDWKRHLPVPVPSSSSPSSSASSRSIINNSSIHPQARLDIESTIRSHEGHWKLRTG